MQLQLGKALKNVQDNGALVQCITNYVTVHDVANTVLACGASPIMADGNLSDVREIAQICTALCVNIGTLDDPTIASMHEASRVHTELGHPIVLDPVGAGASKIRTRVSAELLDGYAITCVRGNISEVKTLMTGSGATQGVDANLADKVTRDNMHETARALQTFAAEKNVVLAVTGEIDLIVDATRAVAITNGSYMQGRITGAGCMLSALTAAFVSANPKAAFEAAVAAVCTMGVAGQRAEKLMVERGHGNATYSNYMIDEIFLMTPERLDEEACHELL